MRNKKQTSVKSNSKTLKKDTGSEKPTQKKENTEKFKRETQEKYQLIQNELQELQNKSKNSYQKNVYNMWTELSKKVNLDRLYILTQMMKLAQSVEQILKPENQMKTDNTMEDVIQVQVFMNRLMNVLNIIYSKRTTRQFRRKTFLNSKGIYDFLVQLDSGVTGASYYKRFKQEIYVVKPDEHFQSTLDDYGPLAVEKLWKLTQSIMVMRECTKNDVKCSQGFYPPTNMLLYSKTYLYCQISKHSERWFNFTRKYSLGLLKTDEFYSKLATDDEFRQIYLEEMVQYFYGGIQIIIDKLF